MRTKKMLACLAAVLLVWMTALPGFAMAEALQVTDAAKAACVQAGGTLLNPDESKRLARHEDTCHITDVAAAAQWLLRNGGRLCCVFPAHRLLELCDAMRSKKIEPKRIRLVCSRADKAPNLCLVEGKLDARPGLHMESTLVIYDEQGQYTPELRRIYGIDS